jgi:hypothetical protein
MLTSTVGRALVTHLQELESAVSSDRIQRYLSWAGGDQVRALELYSLNTRLSEALYTPLQALELALRNRIHAVMCATHSARWFDSHSLIYLVNQRGQLRIAYEELARERKEPTPGRIIAALTFSFWTAMLAGEYEDLWRSTLYKIATSPDGRHLPRKDLSRPLRPIRVLRNRIAHHEPILHWNLRRHYDGVMKLTSCLSPRLVQWCSEIQNFTVAYPTSGYTLAAGAGVAPLA